MANWFPTSPSLKLERHKAGQLQPHKPTVQDELSFARSLQSVERRVSTAQNLEHNSSETDELVLEQFDEEKRHSDFHIDDSGYSPVFAISGWFEPTDSRGFRTESLELADSDNKSLLGYSNFLTDESTTGQTQTLSEAASQCIDWFDTNKNDCRETDWQIEMNDANGMPVSIRCSRSSNGTWVAELNSGTEEAEFKALELALSERGVILKRTQS